jgi:hypothetical protein
LNTLPSCVTNSQSSTSCFFSVKGNCDIRRLSEDLLSFSWINQGSIFCVYFCIWYMQ